MSTWSAAHRRVAQVRGFRRDGAVRAPALTASPVQQYQTVGPTYGPIVGPDGAVWFADGLSDLGRFDPATQNLQQIPVLGNSPTNPPTLGDLASALGVIWFGISWSCRIGWSTTDGTTNFADTWGWTSGPILGPNGSIWFGEDVPVAGGAKGPPCIGQVNPNTGEVTQTKTRFWTIDPIAGPDGNVWFGEWGPKIGMCTPGGSVTEYDVKAAALADSLLIGPDGNVWFGSDVTIGYVNPSNGTVTQFDIGGNGAFGLMIGPDGNIWFGCGFSSQIGRVTPQGDVRLFAISNLPAGLIADGSGNIWFTEFGANVGYIDTATLQVQEFRTIGATPYPPAFAPASKTIWFPDNGGDLPSNGYIGEAGPSGVTEYYTNALPNGLLVYGDHVYFGENTTLFGRVLTG